MKGVILAALAVMALAAPAVGKVVTSAPAQRTAIIEDGDVVLGVQRGTLTGSGAVILVDKTTQQYYRFAFTCPGD